MTLPALGVQDAATDEDGVTWAVLFAGLVLLAGSVLLAVLGTMLLAV